MEFRLRDGTWNVVHGPFRSTDDNGDLVSRAVGEMPSAVFEVWAAYARHPSYDAHSVRCPDPHLSVIHELRRPLYTGLGCTRIHGRVVFTSFDVTAGLAPAMWAAFWARHARNIRVTFYLLRSVGLSSRVSFWGLDVA